MKKTKEIEIQCCDVCVAEGVQTWKCAGCGADVCEKCCHHYRVTRQRPVSATSILASFTLTPPPTADFTATFCDECGTSEAYVALLRAGFVDSRVGPRDVPRPASQPASEEVGSGA